MALAKHRIALLTPATALGTEFDAVVVNDTVERAAQELVRIMGLDPDDRR